MKKGNKALKLVAYGGVLLMALLVAVGSTFSWYDRNETASANAHVMNYSKSGKITSNSPKTIRTYLGTDTDGIITYSDTELSGNVTALPNKLMHFKTVIEDTGNAGESNISLYIGGLTCTTNLGGAYHIGLTSPEKTYKPVTGSTDGDFIKTEKICLEDNLTVASNGSVEIYWFIKVDKTDFTGAGTITLDSLYTVFN